MITDLLLWLFLLKLILVNLEWKAQLQGENRYGILE